MSTEIDYKNPAYLEWTGRLIILGLLVLPLFYYHQLPDEVPSHFGPDGQPDDYSSKAFVWFLPLLGTALYFFLNFLTKAKNLKLNAPKYISPEEEERRRVLGIQLLHNFKILIPALFLFLNYRLILTAINQAKGLGTYTIYIFLASIFGVIGHFMFQAYKNPDSNN